MEEGEEVERRISSFAAGLWSWAFGLCLSRGYYFYFSS
jgi:hypothetical protein